MRLALLRKDLHLLRLPLLGGLLLALFPYLLHAVPRLDNWWRGRALAGQVMYWGDGGTVHSGRYADRETVDREFVERALLPASLLGLGLVALMAAACGGIAFAAERRDRSAEFIEMLPVSRGRVVRSKLLAAGLCLLGPAALHAAVLALGWRELAGLHESYGRFERQFAVGAANCAALALMMFGVAWLLSSFFESPAVAGVVAIGVAAVMVYLVADAGWHAEVADDRKAVVWTPAEYVTGILWRPGVYQQAPAVVHDAVRALATLTGASALLAGALVFARRVRP
jgi:hypothetical protein